VGISILILGLILTLSACDMGIGNDLGDESNGEDLVWETFSNDYFKFTYPGPWQELYEDYLAVVADGLDEEESDHAFMSMYMGYEVVMVVDNL